jgi:inhibitor of KinA sporulation pathway (predicted exonuclease)
MNYIVFDLEWNQCPDGKEKENKNLPFEIIEIGAVKLDLNYNRIDQFSEYVKPCVYKEIHFKTKEVIHVNMEDLSVGRSFLQVCKSFLDWCGDDFVFATWGNMDLTELQRNMKYHGLKYKFSVPLKYYDVQKVFSLLYEESKTRRTLEYAIDYLEINMGL